MSLTGGDGEISYHGRFMCQSSENASLLLLKRSVGQKENNKSLVEQAVCACVFVCVRVQCV